jgi:ATP-binding protein involved in chromosome partitioning
MEECDNVCESGSKARFCEDPKMDANRDSKSPFEGESARMSRIKHKILVGSGKGGVGKSTVTVNLARALKDRGFSVGVIDGDITGPNIPKLLGIEDQKLHQGPEGIEPANAAGIKVVSMALILSSRDSPVVWRGPMKMGALRQFLLDVNWGDLDFLLIDLPPGTSDEPISIIQLVPNLTGAIIVTTPQEVSLLDSRKAVNMIKSMDKPVLGIIENMSGLCCPHCGEMVYIFSQGGGERAAGELGVPFLGSIPMDPEVSALGDRGVPFAGRESHASRCFDAIVQNILKSLPKIENNLML